MPRFQSRLFNWIDGSLPVQLGRRARLWFGRSQHSKSEIFAGVRDIGRQAAKVLLYPLYALTQAAKQNNPYLNPAEAEPPLLLRPVQGLALWLESTELFSKPAAISNTPSTVDNLADNLSVLEPPPQHLEDRTAVRDAQQLERIRQLIKAAIAYFFSQKGEHFDTPTPTSGAIAGDPQLTTTSSFGARLLAGAQNIGKQIARAVLYPLYALTKAAKSNPYLNPTESKPPLLLRPVRSLMLWLESTNLFTTATANNPDKSTSVNPFPSVWQQQFQHLEDPSDRYEQQLERIRQLIKAAIAYFFGKKGAMEPMDSNSPETNSSADQPWLTMADLFGDDEGPWPLPADRETLGTDVSDSLTETVLPSSESRALAIDSHVRTIAMQASTSYEIAITTTASDRSLTREGSATEIEPLNNNNWLDDESEPNRPMQAWIDTQAIFLGYVYNPVMEFIHWLDRAIARFEECLIGLWQRLCRWFQALR